jgi:secondary thiamine-phosphate synthase enzyme
MSNHAFEKSVDGQGLYDITAQVSSAVASSGVQDGLATVFIQHTSASLLVQENADPAVQADLQNWLSRLVLENDPLYTHTEEGPDDMPGHIKGALTAVQVGVPVMQGKLALGVWQGVYLWEHRHSARTRSIIVNVMGD